MFYFALMMCSLSAWFSAPFVSAFICVTIHSPARRFATYIIAILALSAATILALLTLEPMNSAVIYIFVLTFLAKWVTGNIHNMIHLDISSIEIE